MIKLLNKYKKLIIMISFAYIYMLVILLVPSGFSLITPGEISSINNVYEIEGIEFTNNFNTVSVYSWHDLTVFQKWAVNKNKYYDLYEQPAADKNLSLTDIVKQGNISKQTSHEQAIIAAYEKAHEKDSRIKIDYTFEGLVIYNNYGKFTNIGDLVVGINGVTIDSVPNYNDFLLLAYDEVVVGSGNYKLKQNMKLTLANGTEIQTDYVGNEYMYFMPKFKIDSTTPKYIEKVDKRNVGGPSGGAMQALTIYSALLNLKVPDEKIAGTGTIELMGYKVGKIGGLKQKYYTVIDNKVDVFFVPKAQLSLLDDLLNTTNIKVVGVDTLDEIIEELYGNA